MAYFIITTQFLTNELSLDQSYLFCGRKLLESGTVALVHEQIKECFCHALTTVLLMVTIYKIHSLLFSFPFSPPKTAAQILLSILSQIVNPQER